jgi:phosphoadenosine phosphosulfate reductase
VAISGGKDSDILIQLCKMGDVWGKEGLRPLHRCTTIDPKYTLKHVKDQGVEILRPRKTFAECILSSGIPSMFRRHCCGELKEYGVEDYVVIGVRKSESVKRDKRYSEPTACVQYDRGGYTEQYYPLLDWTDDDVAEFVRVTGIQCHPLYYDEQGKFHVERRLGCMCCPLIYRKKRVEEFKKYPNMLRFYIKYGQRYLDTHPNAETHKYFDDAYEQMLCDLFYKDVDSFLAIKRQSNLSLLGGVNAKETLEQYFNIDLSL